MENNQEKEPQKKSISEVINDYKKNKEGDSEVKSTEIPTGGNNYSPENFETVMNKETDPDLITSFELIKLPSKGLFYKNKISEVEVEYMTSRDEDLLTTPSLIESGKVLELLLKRKVKTKGISIDELLPGDRNAILLFLRISSYGPDYSVEVTDPRNGVPFKTKVDLQKLEYKEIKEYPDNNGYYFVDIPMRKKRVQFRLISNGEDNKIFKTAQELKEAYNLEYSEYNTLKIKAQIVSIDGNTDRNYINKFVDAMPALDAFTIRKKIQDVSPDVDMSYEFITKDGYKFKAQLSVGVDFFFPGT